MISQKEKATFFKSLHERQGCFIIPNRIKAAVEAKKTFNFPFMLTARSENFVHEHFDLKDTIRRLQAFQEAGADVLYAPDLRNVEEISAVVKSLDKPLNVMLGISFTVSDLENVGVKRVSLGSLLVRSAIGKVIRSAKEIKEKGTCSFAESATPFGELMGIFKVR